MPHLGGPTSKRSLELGNINRQLKSGKTRGSNPRELPPEEITALEQRRDFLQAQMREAAKERTLSRITAHTTEESNRVIQEVKTATASSARFFENVGGSGSSTDLRVQAAVLRARATEKAKEERKEKREAEKAAKRGASNDAVPPLKRSRSESLTERDKLMKKTMNELRTLLTEKELDAKGRYKKELVERLLTKTEDTPPEVESTSHAELPHAASADSANNICEVELASSEQTFLDEDVFCGRPTNSGSVGECPRHSSLERRDMDKAEEATKRIVSDGASCSKTQAPSVERHASPMAPVASQAAPIHIPVDKYVFGRGATTNIKDRVYKATHAAAAKFVMCRDWTTTCASINGQLSCFQVAVKAEFLKFIKDNDEICKIPLRYVRPPEERSRGGCKWMLEPSDVGGGTVAEIIKRAREHLRCLAPCSADEAGRGVTEYVNGDIGRHITTTLRLHYEAKLVIIGESVDQPLRKLAMLPIDEVSSDDWKERTKP